MTFFSSLSFTKKYSFALSLIAAFSILAFFNLTQIIKSQTHDGEIINLSGRQRMLSQKIALFAIHYKTKQLEKTIELMDDSHKRLLAIPMTVEMKSIYFYKPMILDEKVRAYIKNAKIFTQTRDGRSLTYMLRNSQNLLKDLDYAVSIYQSEAESKIANLHKNEFYILLLTLTTLLFEALFIFRPVNKSVKKKTQELISEKEYSDMITQINTNAIVAVDENFEILTFNKSAEQMFGFSAQEMLHTKLIDDRIIPLKFLKQHNKGLGSYIKTGELKNRDVVFELEGQHKDKTLFPIRISFGTKVEGDKKVVVANIQNITSEKDKDNLIIQQSRFAAMGEMIGNIAHQWRQPLSSISATATGARIRYKNKMISDGELDDTFVKIKNHTQFLSKTIDDFRDFFSQDRKKENININEVVSQSISLVEAAYVSNNIRLHVQATDKSIVINGSSSELAQVFLNILNNAKDILNEKDLEDRVVLVEIFQDNQDAVVRIVDNAGGIPEDIQLKIYEPYFTTKHKSQGTGIGLFMSKKIIEQHFNGMLYSQNKEFEVDGKKYFGAEFNIRIKHT